jgi:hypothetical protein
VAQISLLMPEFHLEAMTCLTISTWWQTKREGVTISDCQHNLAETLDSATGQ